MKNLILIVMLAYVAVIVGCATTGTQAKKEVYVPAFDYTPPSKIVPGSADVTFAIVDAEFGDKLDREWTEIWPLTDFSRNLGLDFQEVLSARGFTVRGPYGSYDEMTHPDKKGSDLILEPVLEVDLQLKNLKKVPVFVFMGKEQQKFKGDCVLGGRVTLSLSESLTKERMWFKSIDIPREIVTWEGENQYPKGSSNMDLDDPGLQNAIARPLEALYNKVMQASWDYLDPEEMAIVKKQADEIKEKKVY